MSDKLELKRAMIKRMPKFVAQDEHKKSKIKARWRKPRGSDSKMKHQFKGYRKIVKRGYMTPSEVKDVHMRYGLKSVIVSNLNELNSIDTKVYGVIISSTVGKLKKVSIMKKAKELKIKVMNSDVDAYIKNFEDGLKEKKTKKEALAKEKEKKEKELQKKAKEKESKKEEKSEDLTSKVEEETDKKAQAKKEKDKVLISKE